MTIGDTGQNKEIKSIEMRVVWPEDKDGNIVYPSWWRDEEKTKRQMPPPSDD
jgi:hypothetical protein